MLGVIRAEIAARLRAARLIAAGSVMIAVGFVFLSVAGWIVLDRYLGALEAALVIGGGFTGIGLLVVGLGSRTSRKLDKRDLAPGRRSAPMSAAGAGLSPALEAFMVGLTAGLAAKARRRGDGGNDTR